MGCVTTTSETRCSKCNQLRREDKYHNCYALNQIQSALNKDNNKQSLPQTRKQPNNQNKMAQNAIDQTKFKSKYGTNIQKMPNQTIQVKYPSNPQKTVFKLIRQPIWIFPRQIVNIPILQMHNATFQQKMTWLRMQVEKMRISWQHGSEVVRVDRHNVLMSSLNKLQNVNLRKQLKIKFDQEAVDDAGGLLRQFMHLAVKQIFSKDTGIFKMCITEQTAYKFIIDPLQTPEEHELRTSITRLLGIIIGKAIFEKISLNCYLNKTIWRQICKNKIEFSDAFSYDRDLYTNWKYIIDNKDSQQLGADFTYLVDTPQNKNIRIHLKDHGSEIMVNEANKQEYINLLMDYFFSRSCKSYLQTLRESINKIIPIDLFEIFEPHQMEMIVNGPSCIDLKEWMESTRYTGYQKNDLQVQWFWKYVEKLDNHKLGNLLHYTTGSRRVPILGFHFLESNRNNVCRFEINKVNYDKINPYPKSHTCFNRLDLPLYSTKQELQSKFEVILINEINSFGLS